MNCRGEVLKSIRLDGYEANVGLGSSYLVGEIVEDVERNQA